jgi:hypothetical protein
MSTSKYLQYCHVIVTIDFFLVIGNIEHLYTEHVTTSNYCANANSHTLQPITARTN